MIQKFSEIHKFYVYPSTKEEKNFLPLIISNVAQHFINIFIPIRSQINVQWFEPLWLSVLQFKKTVMIMLLTFPKLTIVMEDKEGGSHGNDLIDEFTIPLSISGANNLVLTGEEQLATIALSYQIHCKDLPDCPSPALSSTSK